jgi:site-specific DNA recombinase
MTHRRRSEGYQKYDADNAYACSSYRQLTRDCTMHYIRVSVVEDLILATIRKVSGYVRENENDFVQQVREASSVRQEETVKNYKKRLGQSQKRHDELDILVKKLYESYATGKIPDRQFERLLSEYDKEQSDLEDTIAWLRSEIDGFNANSVKSDKFIQLVKRYTDFTELTTPMLNEFVEKVVVHETDKSTGERVQKVDIYFNFIGQFDVDLPDAGMFPEQLEKERKRQEQNNREREKNKIRMRLFREKQTNQKAVVNF